MFSQVNILGKVLEEKVIENAKKNASVWAGKQKQNLSPSMDFMCMTKTYFNFKYSGKAYLAPDDNEFSYTNERAKEIGNNFHNYIESILKTTDVLRLSEATLVDEENRIRARLDMIVEVNGVLYLTELKSAKQYSVKMMQQEGSPDLEHQKQLQLYFHLYEKNKNNPEIFSVLQGRSITRGILLYEDKDGHKVTEFLVNKNQPMIDDLLRFGSILFDHIKQGEEPNFKFESNSRECMYKCKPQYYMLCHKKEKVDPRKTNNTPPKDQPMWGVADSKKLLDEEGFI